MGINKVEGLVTRLYVDKGVTYVQIQPWEPDPNAPRPKSGYFRLSQAHENYAALYSLLLACALQGRWTQVRTEQDIVPTAFADIRYVVVDFPFGSDSAPAGVKRTSKRSTAAASSGSQGRRRSSTRGPEGTATARKTARR